MEIALQEVISAEEVPAEEGAIIFQNIAGEMIALKWAVAVADEEEKGGVVMVALAGEDASVVKSYSYWS
ncbi:hypothetical protein GCM10007161_12970 [Ignatzschineria indica]|nr:hypothetical protein GCM10007161_12970 [Ignatzschineria indica]